MESLVKIHAQVFMQIAFKIRRQFSLSMNSKPNSKMSGYFYDGSV